MQLTVDINTKKMTDAYQNRFPAPSGVAATTQNVYQDAEKQIGSGIKDLKNTAKDIIGIFKK